MEKKNNKVPIAILSCFLIAFILQGILKLSGVFIFEKALNWEVFKIIDNSLTLQIIYYSILNLVASYCLSFALTSRPYSNKWYHYILLLLGSFGITSLKLLFKHPMFLEFIYDAISYIIIPVIINFTTNKEARLFSKLNLTGIIITISIQILLYFGYLGLNYWSALLNTIMPITQSTLYASANFLIQFEVYVGVVLLMLSLNSCIKKFKIKEK